MKIFLDKKVTIGFSEAGDGDLSFYNMNAAVAESVWKKLEVVEDLSLELPTYANQVHRDRIIRVEPETPYFLTGEGDGLITGQANRPIGVFSADCLPLIIFSANAAAAVHAGWRSTCLNIGQKAVAEFTDGFAVSPNDLKAFIGPCIGQCCLEMGEEVFDQFVAADRQWSKFFVKREKWHLDLRGLNRWQLVQAGVTDHNIVDFDCCTFCREKEYFSFRRQRQRNGSMFSFVVRHE